MATGRQVLPAPGWWVDGVGVSWALAKKCDVFGDFKSCPHLPASLLIGFDDAASLDRSQNSVDYNERQGNGCKCTQKTRHVHQDPVVAKFGRVDERVGIPVGHSAVHHRPDAVGEWGCAGQRRARRARAGA